MPSDWCPIRSMSLICFDMSCQWSEAYYQYGPLASVIVRFLPLLNCVLNTCLDCECAKRVNLPKWAHSRPKSTKKSIQECIPRRRRECSRDHSSPLLTGYSKYGDDNSMISCIKIQVQWASLVPYAISYQMSDLKCDMTLFEKRLQGDFRGLLVPQQPSPCGILWCKTGCCYSDLDGDCMHMIESFSTVRLNMGRVYHQI